MIGQKALKITLIQTVPGRELAVAAQLTMACKSTVESDKFAIFKGLGGFDLILIYETNNFGSHLTPYGPIAGILKYNQLLSFPIQHDASDDFFSVLNMQHFIGISLIKIDPLSIDGVGDFEDSLIERLHVAGSSGRLFGTLGWSEYIAFLFDKNVLDILKHLVVVNRERRPKAQSEILKTFSYIAVNYRTINCGNDLLDECEKICSSLCDNEHFSHLIGDESGLRVYISSDPCAYAEIMKYWSEVGFKAKYIMGNEDAVVVPQEGSEITWGKFLAKLLTFRSKYSLYLHSTRTTLRIDGGIVEESVDSDHGLELNKEMQKDEVSDQDFFEFINYKMLCTLFNDRIAGILEGHYFALSSLLQHNLISSAFLDMQLYPKKIKEIGESFKTAEKPVDGYILECAEALSNGAEIRSYGVGGNIENVYGRFPRLKGGIQRGLLAIEYIPLVILKRLKKQWEGFINISDQRFYHINEVIVVPVEALWDPTQWWAVYHEIGHLLVDTNARLVNENLPSVRSFLVEKIYQDYWLWLLQELAAEVIGFELGFFGDIELFLELLWPYLFKTDGQQPNSARIETYLVRTFYVVLFEKCFRLKEISKENFKNEEFLYREFMDHASSIEKILRKNSPNFKFPRKNFIVANNTRLFSELYQFSEHLYTQLIDLEKDYGVVIETDKLLLANERCDEAYKTVMAGTVWEGEIVSPEVILYKLFKEHESSGQKIEFNAAMALIITFWGKHLQIIKEDIDV
ncbi:MAG: hypothetical protein AB9872_14070 [Solidesulfovibrio sp.]